jgi:uncharacterized protein (TIGR02646 family)
MKGARKVAPPKAYDDWIALENDAWHPSYPFNDGLVRDAVVEALFLAQRGLCVYCGRALDRSMPGKSFHVEHFRPQHAYKTLEVTFDNLFLSCGQEDPQGGRSQICGTRKDKWFDDLLHVEPVYPLCVSVFEFKLNGDVAGSTEPARKMAAVLNLNHAELVKEREQVFLLIDSGELDVSDFWDAESGIAESYAHVAFKHFGAMIP